MMKTFIMPVLTYQLMLVTSDLTSHNGTDNGDDDDVTDSNFDSDGSADQDEESISDQELNRAFQEDIKVGHEHVDPIDFHTMYESVS